MMGEEHPKTRPYPGRGSTLVFVAVVAFGLHRFLVEGEGAPLAPAVLAFVLTFIVASLVVRGRTLSPRRTGSATVGAIAGMLAIVGVLNYLDLPGLTLGLAYAGFGLVTALALFGRVAEE
jgi:hypothetical protein